MPDKSLELRGFGVQGLLASEFEWHGELIAGFCGVSWAFSVGGFWAA